MLPRQRGLTSPQAGGGLLLEQGCVAPLHPDLDQRRNKQVLVYSGVDDLS